MDSEGGHLRRLSGMRASSAPLGRRRPPMSWPLGTNDLKQMEKVSNKKETCSCLLRAETRRPVCAGTLVCDSTLVCVGAASAARAASAASATSTLLAPLVLNTRGRLARTNAPASTQSDWHAEPDAKSSSLIARHPHASPSWATLHARECTRPALPPLVIRTMRTSLWENTSTSTSIGTSTSAGALTGTLKSTL